MFSVLASGELCQFPQDHPIPPGDQAIQTMDNHRVHVYTDQFGGCHGCVRELHFCYRRGGSVSTVMTIEIRNPGTTLDTHTVTVMLNDRSDCGLDGLGSEDCCVEQVLTESFIISQNQHFALRIPNTANLLLRLSSVTANGFQENLSGDRIGDSVYKPLLFFVIDSKFFHLSDLPAVHSQPH